ncbi:unnamed protein product [Menidia menidia]|uniref:(Atlantic silverside) hypothetical protein n=1 Tax=Menidia menidia TaxID=238744 RepID=A0A8S4BT65_9TELE|nr:unnamed protein product [Menidia menidia]
MWKEPVLGSSLPSSIHSLSPKQRQFSLVQNLTDLLRDTSDAESWAGLRESSGSEEPLRSRSDQRGGSLGCPPSGAAVDVKSSTLSSVTSLLCVISSLQGRKSTAEAGQKAWMTCGAGEERTIPALERLRPDLMPDEMVALSQTFRNRVDLQDRQMKDGDVSLTLKDVTVNDTGTYQSRVSETQERNREMFKKPPSPSIWT